MPEQKGHGRYFVNVTRDKIVEEGSPEAAFQLHEADVRRLGLLKDEPKGKPAEAKPAPEAKEEPAAVADVPQPQPRRQAERR